MMRRCSVHRASGRWGPAITYRQYTAGGRACQAAIPAVHPPTNALTWAPYSVLGTRYSGPLSGVIRQRETTPTKALGPATSRSPLPPRSAWEHPARARTVPRLSQKLAINRIALLCAPEAFQQHLGSFSWPASSNAGIPNLAEAQDRHRAAERESGSAFAGASG